jgi:cytochrome P450
MTRTITFGEQREVEAALANPDLVPPEAPPSLGSGPTAALRAAMARFSSGHTHLDRRTEVVAAIEALAPTEVRSSAASQTAMRLDGSRLDAVADLAYHVPTEALADAFGIGDDVEGLTADVRQLVEAIGRGAPSSASSDEAATRLLDRVEHHPAGAVPVASVLYQTYDATAALLTTTIVSRRRPALRRSAIVRTLRFASTDTVVAGTPVPAGTLVVLDLETTGLEFGAGPHRCPGGEIAAAIVAGAMDALADRRYEPVPELVVLDDGRPAALPMEPRC